MSERVALDLTKMAQFTNNDELDEYLDSAVPACEWVEHAAPDLPADFVSCPMGAKLPEEQPTLDEPCCCHLEQVIFTTPCAMCDADLEATETDKSVIRARHCPQHKMPPVCGWPRPLCYACKEEWKIQSVQGGQTRLAHRHTGARVLHGVVRVHQK